MYNGFNQLVSVSNDDVDAEYTYAPSGLRLTKTVDGEQIYFINDGDNVIAELYEDEVTAYYLRGRNLYGSFIGNDEYFYLYNAHGDVVNLTDTSGYIEHTYRYDAFGNEREPESSDNNPFRYCGEYYDGETGSYYLRARYYDPVVGRFTQQDSYRGDTTDPLSLNYYVYCASNPLAYHDPSGNYWETAFDFASFGLSLKDFLNDPSLFNAGFLLWDAVALAAPIPGSYAGKALGLVNDTDNVSDVFKLIRNVDADAMNDIAQTTTKHGDFSNLSGNLSGQINKSSKAYTKNNFRTNLKKLTNQTGVGMQAHHVFPQKFETEFQRAGIMIHDPKYGSWVETLDHQKWSNAYNKSWEEFFKSTVTPTEQQIYQKARDLAKQYNFTLNFK